MAQLITHVHVHHPNHGTVVFGPDDNVPGWARKLITRDDVWDDDAPVVADDQAEDPEDPGQGGQDEGPEPPPRSGKGSGVDAWREFAAHPDVDLDVADDASKDDIIAAYDAATEADVD